MRKKFYGVGAVIASVFLGSVSAFACPNGQCPDREAVFTDVLNFSKGIRCPTLSAQQALHVASAASTGQLDPEGFKKAYGSSCAYDDSFSAASDGYKAEVFTKALDYSNAIQCPTLSSRQALDVASAADSHSLNPEGFNRAYNSSCAYDDSFRAASNGRKAKVFQEVLDYSKGIQCPTLSSHQALDIAQATDAGNLNSRDFELAYNSSCNYDDSFAAARCQNLGSLQGNAETQERLASARENNGSGKADLVQIAMDVTPANASARGSQAGAAN